MLVRISTEIAVVDDPKKVRSNKIVEQLNLELEAYWRGLRDGQSAETRIRFEAARKRANALGLTYHRCQRQRSAAGCGGDDIPNMVSRFANPQTGWGNPDGHRDHA
ncbi:MAG: hypothetical protein KIS86_14355 [Devosia sp.]|nr:hypothetical protein [Devosia sp.]